MGTLGLAENPALTFALLPSGSLWNGIVVERSLIGMCSVGLREEGGRMDEWINSWRIGYMYGWEEKEIQQECQCSTGVWCRLWASCFHNDLALCCGTAPWGRCGPSNLVGSQAVAGMQNL